MFLIFKNFWKNCYNFKKFREKFKALSDFKRNYFNKIPNQFLSLKNYRKISKPGNLFNSNLFSVKAERVKIEGRV